MPKQHPVQAVFKHLTSVLEHQLPEHVRHEGPCNCCGSPAENFDYKGYPGRDGYKTKYIHCAACESFNLSDIHIVGIERNRVEHPDGSVTGVGHKFGMLSGSGCIVTASGRVVIFTPPGTYKKLPDSFLNRFEVLSCTIGGHIEYLSKAELDFPLVYIQNFGRKTKELINGLRWSHSRSAIVICTDDGNSSSSEQVNTIDLDSLITISVLKKKLPNAVWNSFVGAFRRLSYGVDTPEIFTQKMKKIDSEDLMKIYRLFPLDPHQRLAILLQVEKI